ncbi:MAG: MerR family transcriptional regulator [Candidatus Marithrix sp.]
MYTISQIAKRFKLSRSTLLYYDYIGLLVSSTRNISNYRLYSDKDIQKMELINIYRQIGLPLNVISKILASEQDVSARILEQRLKQLNQEINQLRVQQQLIIDLLKNKQALQNTRILNKESWIAILKATGLDETLMHKWHIEFEKSSPEAHQDFLESLGIPTEEITTIRKWSVKNVKK